jgi:ParB family chromosome partitioning protein
MNKRKSLGRGLDALLSSARPVPPPASADSPPAAVAPLPETGLREVPVDLLRRGKYQPRVDMREDSLAELAESIKAQGVVQPIVVRPLTVPSPEGKLYEIIAGERRWRAAQRAGLATIPAVIRRVPDEAAVAMSLIENIQREALNPLEEARALDRLIREFDMTHQTAADAVGRSRAAVSNLLRLLELAEEVKYFVEQRQLEMGHARALLGLGGSHRQQIEVAALVVKKGLSVRETEALVRRFAEHQRAGAMPSTTPPAEDPNIRALREGLAEKLGATVELQHGAKGQGKLVIRYNSLDELDGILAHIN